jgi:hypothetical protein
MAQQPYMGSGLFFPRLLGRAHSWQLVTGCCSIDPDVTARAIWQAVMRLGWEIGVEFCLRNISIHARKVLLYAVNLRHGTDGFTSPPKEVVLRIFLTLKNPSTSRTLGPVVSTLTTSAQRVTQLYTGHTQKNGAVSIYSILLKPHHSFVYALYICHSH